MIQYLLTLGRRCIKTMLPKKLFSPYLRVGEQHVIKDGKITHAKYKYYNPITKKSHWRVVYACR